MGVIRADADALRSYLERGGYASAREVEACTLAIYRGFSLWETAQILGVGFETVRTLLRRLRYRVATAARTGFVPVDAGRRRSGRRPVGGAAL